MQRRGALCGSDIRSRVRIVFFEHRRLLYKRLSGAGSVFRPRSHPPPHSTPSSFCFGYEPAAPGELDSFLDASRGPDKGNVDRQSSQVVGHPGAAEERNCKGNQHLERRALLDRSAIPILTLVLQSELPSRCN
jgi:hypothetical protein